jgi:hypothetical protein
MFQFFSFPEAIFSRLFCTNHWVKKEREPNAKALFPYITALPAAPV